MTYDLMLKKAMDLQNNGALNQAEEIYMQILQTMPENSDVWNLLGLIAQSRGHLERAKDCFFSAIKYAPTPFFAHYFNLGLTYKSLNKPKEAIDALTKAVALKADFKEGWNLLGILQAEAQMIKEAVKSFCKALEIDNDYSEARANLCFYTNDFTTLLKLAHDEPHCFQAQFLAAEISEAIENKKNYLEKALATEPYRSDVIISLAKVALAENDFNDALTFYYKALNFDDKNIEAILGIADIYLQQENFDKAEQFYLKSFDITRDIVGAHINYGIVLYHQKRFTEALNEYRTAVSLDPDNPEISFNLALILKETGETDEALGLMFNAHMKKPENEVFAINIMETLQDLFLKNPEQALKIAQNWQKLMPDNIFSKKLFNTLSGFNDESKDIEFTEKLFDNFALVYEKTLEKLNPQIISYFKSQNKSLEGHILDLGCGTGLAAVALKNAKNRFDGVDISANMLELAKQKNLYDNLYHEDILSFLTNHSCRPYSHVIAFDVFCYFGKLDLLLKKLKGTDVWFTLEAADESRGQDFYPSANGRYKHKRSYVETLLKTLKYKQIQVFDLVLRQENGENVDGYFVHVS